MLSLDKHPAHWLNYASLVRISGHKRDQFGLFSRLINLSDFCDFLMESELGLWGFRLKAKLKHQIFWTLSLCHFYRVLVKYEVILDTLYRYSLGLSRCIGPLFVSHFPGISSGSGAHLGTQSLVIAIHSSKLLV